jgi:DNA-binding NarL/FixJ family response regulator
MAGSFLSKHNLLHMVCQHHWYFDKNFSLYYHHLVTDRTVADADLHYAEDLTGNKLLLKQVRKAEMEISITLDSHHKMVSQVAIHAPAEAYFLLACDYYHLSYKQTDIMRTARTCRKRKELAAATFCSPHTVRNHLDEIYTKLDVHSLAEALQKLQDLAKRMEGNTSE